MSSEGRKRRINYAQVEEERAEQGSRSEGGRGEEEVLGGLVLDAGGRDLEVPGPGGLRRGLRVQELETPPPPEQEEQAGGRAAEASIVVSARFHILIHPRLFSAVAIAV